MTKTFDELFRRAFIASIFFLKEEYKQHSGSLPITIIINKKKIYIQMAEFRKNKKMKGGKSDNKIKTVHSIRSNIHTSSLTLSSFFVSFSTKFDFHSQLVL